MELAHRCSELMAANHLGYGLVCTVDDAEVSPLCCSDWLGSVVLSLTVGCVLP